MFSYLYFESHLILIVFKKFNFPMCVNDLVRVASEERKRERDDEKLNFEITVSLSIFEVTKFITESNFLHATPGVLLKRVECLILVIFPRWYSICRFL